MCIFWSSYIVGSVSPTIVTICRGNHEPKNIITMATMITMLWNNSIFYFLKSSTIKIELKRVFSRMTCRERYMDIKIPRVRFRSTESAPGDVPMTQQWLEFYEVPFHFLLPIFYFFYFYFKMSLNIYSLMTWMTWDLSKFLLRQN
jgi:hypothetical protein